MRTNLPYTLQNSFAPARDEAEVQSLLNNDIYKFLMLDFILARPEYTNLNVRWKMKVRNQDVQLGNVIPEGEFRAQLEAMQSCDKNWKIFNKEGLRISDIQNGIDYFDNIK